MRSETQKANLAGYSRTPREVTEGFALGALTNDHKIEVWEPAHRFDHTIMPLALDQVANGKQSRARQPQVLARHPEIWFSSNVIPSKCPSFWNRE